jgi:hypothetical protein
MCRIHMRVFTLLLLGCLGSVDAKAGLSIFEVCNEGDIPVWIATVTESRFLVFAESVETSTWSKVDADDCDNVWTQVTSGAVMLNVVVGVENAAGEFGVMGRELSGMPNIRHTVCIGQKGFPSTDSDAIPPCTAPYRDVPTYSAYWVPGGADIKLEVDFSLAEVATLHSVLSRRDGSAPDLTSGTSGNSSAGSERSKGFWEIAGDSYEALQEDRRQMRAACQSWGLPKIEREIDRTEFCNCAAEALVANPADRNTVFDIKRSGWAALDIQSCPKDPYLANLPERAPSLGPAWSAVNKQLDADLWEIFGLSVDWRFGSSGKREYGLAYWSPNHAVLDGGLTRGDIIQEIGVMGRGPIQSQRDLIDQLNGSVSASGSLVPWTVVRDGQIRRFEVRKFGGVAPRR